MSINAIYSAVTYYPSVFSLCGGLICAAAAAEIAHRLFTAMQDETQPSQDHIRQEAGRAIFFSLCATNLVPYTAFLGGLIFYLHSWITLLWDKTHKQEAYTLSAFLVIGTVETAKALWPYLLSLAERTYLLLSKSPSIISLKEKEVWRFTALLTAVIFITKGPLWIKFGSASIPIHPTGL